MRIVIAGAGIGGLATALSLEAAGFRDITIYERAPEIRGLGVGINLLPHALRELTELGLHDRIAAIGVPPATLSYYSTHGQLIWTEPRGLHAGYRWPQYSVHRGELQLTLLQAVKDRLGDIVKVDHKLVGVAQGEHADVATFTSGGETFDVEADLIVGADGIHSSLRAQFYPDDRGPVWSGLTLWRGTARIPAYLDGTSMIMAGDGQMRFVAYPLEPIADDGTQRVNFIAERRQAGLPNVDWNSAVDPTPIVELFTEWRFDWLDVPGTIAAAEEILEYPMVDRDAIPRWSFGRTTLLGDAAHAMYPNGSNGASQAILDARTLAFHLATAPSVQEALIAYDDDRRPVTTALMEGNRRGGPERVMQLAQDRAPEGFEHIHDVISQEELEEAAASFKRAAGFLPEVLNERASLTPPVRAE